MVYYVVRRLLFPLFRSPVKIVEGVAHIPATGGFLIAANHIDFLDGFFITVATMQKRRDMVKFLSETNNYWWTGGATIPVEKKAKARSLDKAVEGLRRGAVVCIFPEGQRNGHGRLVEGKTGLARLALRTGLPVLPMGIVGPSGRNMLESLELFFLRRKTITVRIGPPLDFSRYAHEPITRELLHAITAEIMAAVAPLCEKRYP